ncbi:MAG: cadherin-like beta sandwich domain-containing protein, partial [Muribaculaceae bacterium]|nr:cadherin-like beta sandwich domain-containing protein [Muribaculaceae bacterium]
MMVGDYYLSFDRTYNRHILDYRFSYELKDDGTGKLAVYADATTSFDLMKAYADSYYPDYYQGVTYSKYYDIVLEALKAGQTNDGDYAGLSQADLEAATVLILKDDDATLRSTYQVITDSYSYRVTYADVLRNESYTTKIANEAAQLTSEAKAKETIWVTIGEKDNITYEIYDKPTTEPGATKVMSGVPTEDIIYRGVSLQGNGQFLARVVYYDSLHMIHEVSFTFSVPSSVGTPESDDARAYAIDMLNKMAPADDGYQGDPKTTKRLMDVDLDVTVVVKDAFVYDPVNQTITPIKDGKYAYKSSQLKWTNGVSTEYRAGAQSFVEGSTGYHYAYDNGVQVIYLADGKQIVVPSAGNLVVSDGALNILSTTAITGMDPAQVYDRQDYMRIPVELYVPNTGFKLDYSATYHILSHDATLKPGKWGVDMGVQGYDPDYVKARIQPTDPAYEYSYDLPNAVREVYIWANINHDHDNTQAGISLYRQVGSDWVLQVSNVTNLHQLVSLNVGVNDFRIVVTSELGDTETYLIRINRAGVDLALEYVRVNGIPAIYEPTTDSYFAYVPKFAPSLGNRPTVTAQAVDHKYGITTIWNSLVHDVNKAGDINPADGAYIGREAKLSGVTLRSEYEIGTTDPNTPMQIMVSMESVDVTRRSYDGPLPADQYPADMNDEDGTLITRDANGYVLINNNEGIVTKTAVTYAIENGELVTTTTKTQYRVYNLNLIEVESDLVGVIVDSHYGTFLPVDGDRDNPRTAKWDENEDWYNPPAGYESVMNVISKRNTVDKGVSIPDDDRTVFGTYVVGVPSKTKEVSIRVNTLVNNDNDLQQVKIGATPWRVADRATGQGGKPTNNFTIEGMLKLVIPDDVDYMEVPIYLTYNKYNESDPGILYMLHIYRYSSDAYLANLEAETPGQYTESGKPTPLTTSPVFQALPGYPAYDITVESNVETVDFTDILPNEGSTETVQVQYGIRHWDATANGGAGAWVDQTSKNFFTQSQLDGKVDIYTSATTTKTIEREHLISVVEDGFGTTKVTYNETPGDASGVRTETITATEAEITFVSGGVDVTYTVPFSAISNLTRDAQGTVLGVDINDPVQGLNLTLTQGADGPITIAFNKATRDRYELRNVVTQPGVTRMNIKVTSQDRTVSREYTVTIIRKTDPNAAKLRDIQMFQGVEEVVNSDAISQGLTAMENLKPSDYYDFSPVFDPDNGRYYFAVPELMTGDIYLNPVTYSDATYQIVMNSYRNGQPQIANWDVTDRVIIVPALGPGETFQVELKITRTGASGALTGGSTDYTLYFYKNDITERTITATNNLKDRVDYSPFSDLKLDGQPLTRNAASTANASDHNFYYNTTGSQVKLSLNLFSLAANNGGYKVYWSNMRTQDAITGETAWNEIANLTGVTTLDLDGNSTWFVLKATDGVNKFYSSIAVYRDPGDAHDTHLENMSVSKPTVPLFRDNLYEYFAAVDVETGTAKIIAQAKTSGSYLTELRVRSVGGEYLAGDILSNGARVETGDIPLHQGSNRVTVTVKHVVMDTAATAVALDGEITKPTEDQRTYKRAYEVELYLAGETAYTVDKDTEGNYEQTFVTDTSGNPIETYVPVHTASGAEADNRLNREERLDTADIIWMDYTTGGHLTPIWNSDLVDYFLSYPYYSDQYEVEYKTDKDGNIEVDPSGNPIPLVNEYGLPVPKRYPVGHEKAGQVMYLVNDHLELKATLRPEEVDRATVSVDLVTVDPVTKDKTYYANETLNRDPITGEFRYTIPKLHEGESQIFFTVQVKGKKLVDGTTVFTDDLVTEKHYMITVYRNRTDHYEMPNVAENTAIRVNGTGLFATETFGTIPDFDPEINFYYLNLPNEARDVELSVEPGVFTKITGSVQTRAYYTVYVNGKTVLASDFTAGLYNPIAIHDLMVGDNTVEIDITVPGQATKYYTFILNVGDTEQQALDATDWPLPSMDDIRINTTLGGALGTDQVLIPGFHTDIHYYNVVVPYEISQVYAYGEAHDAGELRIASINVDDVRWDATTADKLSANLAGWREIPIPLKVGNENNIEFVAYGRDKDGNVTDTMVRYIVNVVRLPEGYMAPELEFLGVDEGTMTPAFHGRTNNYYVTVPYDVESVNVESFGTTYSQMGLVSNDPNRPASLVKMTGGDSVSVGRALYVADSKALEVGDNIIRVYLYDVRDIPDGGYPFYIGVYSLTIHREAANGVIMELGDSQRQQTDASGNPIFESDGTTPVMETIPAISVQRVDKDGIAHDHQLNLPYEFNEYTNYLYVERDDKAVILRANAIHPDNIVTIDGVVQPATGGVTVTLPEDNTSVVVIAVTDPKTDTTKRYTITVVRGRSETEAAATPMYGYNWPNVITGIQVTGTTTAAASTLAVGGEVKVSPYIGTITLASGETYTGKLVDVTVEALYDSGMVTVRAAAATRVRINGHVARMVTGDAESSPYSRKYTVTLPMNTYTDRFDIRVDYPIVNHNVAAGKQAEVVRIDNISYVLMVVDEANAPHEVDTVVEESLYGDIVKPLRWTQEDYEAWVSAETAKGTTALSVDDWTAATGHAIGAFKYTDKVITGPQLAEIQLDENDSTVHSGTFTTKFYGDVFNYRATAQGDKFSVYASVETDGVHTAQYADTHLRRSVRTYTDHYGKQVNIGDFIDAQGNRVVGEYQGHYDLSDVFHTSYVDSKGVTVTQGDWVDANDDRMAGDKDTALAKLTADELASITADRATYIEVYDEANNRFTISKTGDFVHFTFPKNAAGERQVLNLTFRVIQYADSGYELVSEYKLRVYPSGEPLVDNLYLYKATMDGPKPFDTLVRDYYGTVYKRQEGFGVYAHAEYFDQFTTGWRDGKLSMVARYPELAPYDTGVDDPKNPGNHIVILPGESYTVEDAPITIAGETYEPGDVVKYKEMWYLTDGTAWVADDPAMKDQYRYYEYQMPGHVKVADENGNLPGDADYTPTYVPANAITDVNGKNPGDVGYILTYGPTGDTTWGHEDFSGYFPQETLPN